MSISKSGRASESIGEGCRDPIIDLTYQLLHPRKVGKAWVADARVTRVRLHDWSGGQPPRVGRTYRVRVVGPHYHGVALPDFRFCDGGMAHYDCGA